MPVERSELDIIPDISSFQFLPVLLGSRTNLSYPVLLQGVGYTASHYPDSASLDSKFDRITRDISNARSVGWVAFGNFRSPCRHLDAAPLGWLPLLSRFVDPNKACFFARSLLTSGIRHRQAGPRRICPLLLRVQTTTTATMPRSRSPPCTHQSPSLPMIILMVYKRHPSLPMRPSRYRHARRCTPANAIPPWPRRHPLLFASASPTSDPAI